MNLLVCLVRQRTQELAEEGVSQPFHPVVPKEHEMRDVGVSSRSGTPQGRCELSVPTGTRGKMHVCVYFIQLGP